MPNGRPPPPSSLCENPIQASASSLTISGTSSRSTPLKPELATRRVTIAATGYDSVTTLLTYEPGKGPSSTSKPVPSERESAIITLSSGPTGGGAAAAAVAAAASSPAPGVPAPREMFKQFLTRAFQLRANGSDLPMDQRSLSPESVKRALEDSQGEFIQVQVKIEPGLPQPPPGGGHRRKRSRTSAASLSKVGKTRNSPNGRPTPTPRLKRRGSSSESTQTLGLSPASPRNTRSNTQLVSNLVGKGIRPSQAEHASFFTMPQGQEYLPEHPNIVEDPTKITDFDALTYPVEVPSGKRGVNKQCVNAEALRQLADEMRGYPLVDYDAQLDEAVQALTDTVASINKAKELSLEKAQKDNLKRLSIQFVRDIKRAQKSYLNGLDDVGL
ncbi:hypothetical protein BU24DRAFT_460228 [Aaosphaeria arxii CBS 175.79]|uniref:Uncharacterized protein n=1 Tax=Aaosphaeria arxii CBS 175.79 TaxID=1450172 RepID=A0A6A5XVB5_9PLEO|nr:uncharacterized protein BU24DRAFT_460228 [Aaosphaeria arxii CBS 175.79]KAF2017152.1 hypothetical protein BU24DRAFT_460228 [Aaosphaeria arxii CBS 175.79]